MISCLLLAAGESKRFGANPPKPLAKIGPRTIIESTLTRLLKTQLFEIIVVLGAYAKEISPFIRKDPRIKITTNANYQNGQTSSFKTGLSNLSLQSKGIMLLPVDVPFVKSLTIDSLIETFFEQNPLILIPTFKGKNGHPPIFSIKLSKELKDLKDEEPLYSIQYKYADKILKFSVDDEGTTLSFNTPQELAQIINESNF